MNLRSTISASELVVRDLRTGQEALDRTILWAGRDVWITRDGWHRGRHSEDRVARVRAVLPCVSIVREGSFLEGDEAVDPAHAFFYDTALSTRTRNLWGPSRKSNMYYVSPEEMAVIAEDAWSPIRSVRSRSRAGA
jgi:hypothetical protein